MAERLTFPLFKAFAQVCDFATGYKLYSYEAGTSTPKALYQDAAGTVEHTNPIILSSLGEAEIFVDGQVKLTLTDADDVVQPGWPVDNVEGFSFGHTLTAKIANYTIGEDELNGTVTFTNTGATGAVTFTLPEGEDGQKVAFYVDEAQQVKVQATGTDLFRFGRETSAAGGYFSSSQQGTHVELKFIDGEWVVTNLIESLLVDDTDTWSHDPALTTNEGATGEESHQLVAGTDGAIRRYYVAVNQYLKIVAPSGESVKYLSQETAADGYIRSKQVGAYAQLERIAGQWVVTTLTGTFRWDM